MNDCQATLRWPLNLRHRQGIFTLGLILVGLATTGTTAYGLTDFIAQTTPPAGVTAPPPTPPAAGRATRPTLRLGNQGEAVTELQALLKLLGFYSGSVTGQFDESTQTAVKRFQEVAGVTTDGIVGAATWGQLFPTPPNQAVAPTAPTPPSPTAPTAPQPAAAASRPSSPSSGTPTPPPNRPTPTTSATLPVLRSGTTGDAVARLQERLKALGFYKGTIDGVFGAQTEQAVKLAQRHYNLEADGVVGPATWAAILR